MDTKSFNESPACGIINKKYHSPRLLGWLAEIFCKLFLVSYPTLLDCRVWLRSGRKYKATPFSGVRITPLVFYLANGSI